MKIKVLFIMMLFVVVLFVGAVSLVNAFERHQNGWVYPMSRQPTSTEWNSWHSYSGHVGHDYGQSAEKPVMAIADGKIIDFNNSLSRYGSWAGARGGAVLVKHKTLNGGIFYALYGHNYIKAGLNIGAEVSAGEIVAYTHKYYGSNGERQDHIHFGIHPDEEPSVGINRFRGVCPNNDNCGWVNPKDFLNTHHPLNLSSYFWIREQDSEIIAWTPADVPCNKAMVWAYHGTCDANNSNPGICQIAYDELKAIDSDEYDRDFWRTMFFGSIEEFNQQCNN